MAEPVGLSAQAPNPIQTLSGLLGVQQQRTALGMEQQEARERAGIAKYDWNKHVGPDGLIDLPSLNNPDLLQAAGSKFQQVVTQATQMRQQQLAAQQAAYNLDESIRGGLLTTLSALRSDPDVASGAPAGKQKVNEAFVQFAETHGDKTIPVVAAYGPMIQRTAPGAINDTLRNIGLQVMSAREQAAVQAPTLAQIGSGQLDVGPNSLTRGAFIANELAPGQTQVVGSDALGHPTVTHRARSGEVLGVTGVPSPNADPSSPLFGADRGQVRIKQAETNQEQVTTNRTAASMAPQQIDQIGKALTLSRETATGTAAQWRAGVESALGSFLPSGFQGLDDASKLNELEKLTERIASDASRVLGVDARTDSERASIHKQNANIGYTPQAMQNVLQYALAQTLAMQAKGDVQEAWLSQPGNDVTQQHQFETQFRQAYDPRVFQLYVLPADERSKKLREYSAGERRTIQDKAAKLRDLGVNLNAAAE